MSSARRQIASSVGLSWVAVDAWAATRGGPSAIQVRQHRRLRWLVELARAGSAYYRELYRDLPPHVGDVAVLPPVAKRDLMQRFDDWVTDSAVRYEDVVRFAGDPSGVGADFLQRYSVFTTSGSSGEPAILVHDRGFLTVMAGLSLVRGTLAWSSPAEVAQLAVRTARREERHAGLFATGAHLPAVTVHARRARAAPSRQMRVFSVLTPTATLVDQLNAYQPTRIDSYPSALAALAMEQAAGRLRIRPRLLTAVGETLTHETRATVQTAFGRPLWQHYSSAETGTLAFECRQQVLHLNADWLIVEPVDANMRPVPPGVLSHAILVTCLANTVQPIIRYRIDDSVCFLEEPCRCGSPLPAIYVEGPRDEELIVKDFNGRAVTLAPLAIYGLLKQVPAVEEYQLIGLSISQLELRLRPAVGHSLEAAWQEAERALCGYLAERGVEDIAITLASEPPAPDPRSGKFRFQWSRPNVSR